MRKGGVTFGWCMTAQAVEQGINSSSRPPAKWHAQCPGIAVIPPDSEGKPRECRCMCGCHEGQELVVKPVETKTEKLVNKVTTSEPGGRSKALLDEWRTFLLRGEGQLVVALPEDADAKTVKSVKERMYTAGRGINIKLSIKRDGASLVAIRV